MRRRDISGDVFKGVFSAWLLATVIGFLTWGMWVSHEHKKELQESIDRSHQEQEELRLQELQELRLQELRRDQ
jgi:hypothetical protein